MNDSTDLEKIAQDLAALRKAIRTNSPFLRGVAATSFFGWLSLPFGVFITFFSLGTHFLLAEAGSWESLPPGWKRVFWLSIILFMAGAGLLKIVFIRRRAEIVDGKAGFWRVVRIMYGAGIGKTNLAAVVSMVVVSAFAVQIGHAWYILAIIAIFFAFASKSLGSLVARPEYEVAGWYALATGLLSLFFLESAPWLWLALVWGGLLVIFGVTGILVGNGEARKGPPAAGDGPDNG
jgi:hypothetical protein